MPPHWHAVAAAPGHRCAAGYPACLPSSHRAAACCRRPAFPTTCPHSQAAPAVRGKSTLGRSCRVLAATASPSAPTVATLTLNPSTSHPVGKQSGTLESGSGSEGTRAHLAPALLLEEKWAFRPKGEVSCPPCRSATEQNIRFGLIVVLSWNSQTLVHHSQPI